MKTIKVEEALKLENVIFIDVRTESEYEEDNILNSFSMPLFKDNEHNEVGTIYKMQGKHEAIEIGFDYVSYKLKDIYRETNRLAKEYDNIVVYCARGGMRSGSVVNLLDSLGVNVYKLEGGYKAYRNFVLDYLKNIMDSKQFIVVHGLTGAGKTDLLKMLEQGKIDIIDLEGIAKNSGSTFGFITFDQKPPSQKSFESQIFENLYFSKTDYIFIESESKRVGHVCVPNEIYEGIIRDGYHLLLECSLENRVKRLCRDYIYGKDEENIQVLKDCISKFRKRLGNKTVDEYINLLDEGKYEELVEKYLVEYYDPLYMHSVEKYTYNKVINFDNMDKALDEVINFHKAAAEGAIKC
ncbi:tRNA 2-selenouridine(34) synthase MnmH [Romboutsia lituseburensis]|uniref:tRNA 2-selenouridine(34) synthase MnmH n=1 Tax=Romboutsia lituseburensis TaxID=1537 RepID=UPI00215AA0F5|nr:tRNA 2-selenouridine(34) synthase MnmH [Romboutsia lituseburensis]MCR8745094.1 tRNA 2-selenouridine(34) synthase MnmH [Romboutsia lituseburensis]